MKQSANDVAAGSNALPIGISLRAPRPGELGWMVFRHGAYYAAKFGWGRQFEALVARIVADFAEHHEPARERCWIADRGGIPIGSVMLVRETDSVAKLRLLLVEEVARESGVGRALVAECIAFARQAGYRQVVLFTCSALTQARRLYEAAGFSLVREFEDNMFNAGELAQEWKLQLGAD